MQQTALNLIAIGVFSITFLALLGPVFNISPTIPAALAFVIMGLFTVDTLGWQNRGATLLLDSLSSFEHRQRVIHHEAGHFLVAYFLGVPITGYTLSAWEEFKQGRSGRGGVIFATETPDRKTLPVGEMPLILERYCTVWMAGIAAELIVYGNAEGGGEDRQKVKDTLLAAGLSVNVYRQKERLAQLQAKNLIEQHRSGYEALVKAMQERASIENCCLAIQKQSSLEN